MRQLLAIVAILMVQFGGIILVVRACPGQLLVHDLAIVLAGIGGCVISDRAWPSSAIAYSGSGHFLIVVVGLIRLLFHLARYGLAWFGVG